MNIENIGNFDSVFLCVSVLFSLFFGIKACEIFSVSKPDKCSQSFYLFWFNFCGSMFGWAALWMLQRNNLATIGFPELILFLVAFAGITGHLPMSGMGIFQGISKLGSAIFKKLFS